MAAPVGSFEAASEGRAAGTTTAIRLAAWLLLLVTGLSAMHLLGRGALAAPPVAPGLWPQWWSASDPLVVIVALLRLLVVGLGWYLLVVTLLGLAGHLVRASSLVRLAAIVTVPPARDLIAGFVGLALISATASPTSAAASSTLQVSDPRAPVSVQLTSASPGEPAADELPRLRWRGGRMPSAGTATEDALDVDDLGDPLGPDRSDAADVDELDDPLDPDGSDAAEVDELGDPLGPDGSDAADVDDLDVHVVASGESFWSIAESRLTSAGHPTDDATVAGYWRCLVSANLDRLVVEGEPDLILPGQELVVPPIAASPVEARP